MIWQIEWEGTSTAGFWVEIFGVNFEQTLHDGIEAGMEELEYLQAYGHYCDACGGFRLTQLREFNDIALTDRGEEFRLMPYELCAQCRHEMFGGEPL